MSNSPYYVYWLVLFLSLGCVAIANSFSDESFTIFSLYAVPIWLWAGYLNFRKGRNLMIHLKKNHKDKWKYMISPLPGERGNSFRTLPFVYSADDLNDPVVHRLKEEYKDFVLFIITVFISMPLTFIYLVLL